MNVLFIVKVRVSYFTASAAGTVGVVSLKKWGVLGRRTVVSLRVSKA